MKSKNDTPVLLISSSVCVLMSAASWFGLFTPDFYQQESETWRTQALGQDAINLLVIDPLLIVAGIVGFNRKMYGTLLWAGLMLYVLYTYCIYCFSIHFNPFFVDYCLILGLSFYALLYFWHKINRAESNVQSVSFTTPVGIYFIVVSTIFYALWLSEIIPSIRHSTVPMSIRDAGLFTNPVHVLDLSVVLPGIFITGILLLRKRPLGMTVAPVLLIFIALMDISIAWLALKLKTPFRRKCSLMVMVLFIMAFISLMFLLGYRSALRRA